MSTSCAMMEISNLIVIPLLGSILISSGTQHQMNRSIVYTSEDLRNIRDNVCYDQQYRKLSGQTIKIIRNIKIHKKKKRGSKAGRSKTIDHHKTVNMNNLIRINSDELPRGRVNQKTISQWVDLSTYTLRIDLTGI